MSSRRIPFSVHISYLFVGLLVAFAAITNVVQFSETRQLMTDSAAQRYALIGDHTLADLRHTYGAAALGAKLLSGHELMRASNLEQRLHSLPWLITVMQAQANANAIYVGYATGDFFLLRSSLDDPKFRAMFDPPRGTAWIVQSIQVRDGRPVGEHLFYDPAQTLIERRAKADYQYDPRKRGWFQQATTAADLIVQPAYVFASTGEVGNTFAVPGGKLGAVAAVDITLRSVNSILRKNQMTPNTRIALLNAAGEVLSSNLDELPIGAGDGGVVRLPKLADLNLHMLEKLISETPAGQAGVHRFQDHLGAVWEGASYRMPQADGDLTVWIASPHSELLEGVYSGLQHSLYVALGLLIIGIVAALVLSRLASKPLATLTVEAEKITNFDFEARPPVESKIAEVLDLADAMGEMKGTINRFLKLSSALANETNFNSMLARLLQEMQGVTKADASLIYLADADASHLDLARVRQGTNLLDEHSTQTLSRQSNAAHPLLQGLAEGAQPLLLTAEALRSYFPALREIAHPLTLWALPLRNRDGDLLGALALLVDQDRHPLRDELMAFVKALSSTAAVALNTQRLIEEQKLLLESFIQLIAGAIDAKSPYTGGHCQRVPELTKMLARAACAQQQGPFADFSLNDNQWEELHIAAWLHDCGKVTTPEYVVDKATKLETLYDRIHEIRMRFEVLKRDAEIATLQAIAAGGDATQLQADLGQQLRQLDDDFAFVAQCNEGGEFMAPDRIERIRQVASLRWTRTLSDRLGISHEERQRKERSPEATLPVAEALLADKPEHLFERSERDKIAADNPWGFKVKVPEYMYNRGELYNLSVARGTLSEEERFKINEHMIQTIIMLDKLPFPRHLKNAPEIAGGHHEKMDGTGYPKRLTRDQMSLPARMMAIADIFEALTAVDRPYKKGKTLSEAIKIMAKMQQDQHIDAELFALFLRSGVYREYAERYMPQELIDEVDVEAYLG